MSAQKFEFFNCFIFENALVMRPLCTDKGKSEFNFPATMNSPRGGFSGSVMVFFIIERACVFASDPLLAKFYFSRILLIQWSINYRIEVSPKIVSNGIRL